MSRLTQIIFTGLLGVFLSIGSVNAEVRLMMVEEVGCPWCDRWKAEIGPIYPKTAEGRIAPLVKVMIHDPLEDGITLNSPPIYTPTFILLNDGQEVGRIEGYQSDEFFWWFMETMIKQLPEDLQKDPGA
ncbi:MAG: hypothetical protein L3J30_04735 [Marinosulfonomonas sp.]|nr:hypothetical protein [Marinosulfonomonas sp.]